MTANTFCIKPLVFLPCAHARIANCAMVVKKLASQHCFLYLAHQLSRIWVNAVSKVTLYVCFWQTTVKLEQQNSSSPRTNVYIPRPTLPTSRMCASPSKVNIPPTPKKLVKATISSAYIYRNKINIDKPWFLPH